MLIVSQASLIELQTIHNLLHAIEMHTAYHAGQLLALLLQIDAQIEECTQIIQLVLAFSRLLGSLLNEPSDLHETLQELLQLELGNQRLILFEFVREPERLTVRARFRLAAQLCFDPDDLRQN